MYSDRLKNAQRVLRASAGYRGAIDGKVGPQSLAAALRISGMDTLEAILGPLTPERRVILAAQAILDSGGFEVGTLDGFWGPQTAAAFLEWQGDAMPVRQADMAARFGPAGSPRCTAGLVRVPWRMVLAWDTGQVITQFRCHDLVAASAQRAFNRIAAAYTPGQIRDLGLHLFGGCFNHRTKRGGTTLSTHAYGLAIDFDPARNRLKWGADHARLAQPDARAFWDIWENEGWVSLGRARNFDWMHVQAVGL